MPTTESSLSEVFESEHHMVAGKFDAFRCHLEQGLVRAEPFKEAAEVLRRHIYMEEEVLFPEIDSAAMKDTIAVLSYDHFWIRRLLGLIEWLIASEANPRRVWGVLKALEHRLQVHNAKEEALVYSAADCLDAEGRARVLHGMAWTKPALGWVCHCGENGLWA